MGAVRHGNEHLPVVAAGRRPHVADRRPCRLGCRRSGGRTNATPRVLAVFTVCLCGGLWLAGCRRVVGSDVPGEVERTVAPFWMVSARGPVEVQLYLTSVSLEDQVTLDVSGDDNLVALLETQVEQGLLDVGPPSGTRFVTRRPLVVSAMITDLSYAASREDARVVATGISEDVVSVDALGASRVVLDGAAEQVVVSARDGAVVDLSDLEAGTGSVVASGSAQVFVCVLGELSVMASGSAIVHYTCDPDSVVVELHDAAVCSSG